MNTGRGRFERSVEEWRESLTSDQFRVLRQHGDERPFLNQYWNNHDLGVYVCAGCGNELFLSESQFDSGTGWPTFSTPCEEGAVYTNLEMRFGRRRIAVSCARCSGHLGHVCDDTSRPTGLRYYVNSAAMIFFPEMDRKQELENKEEM